MFAATLSSISAPPWVAGQKADSSKQPPEPGGYTFDSKVGVSPTMAIIFICLISTFFLIGCVSVYLRQCAEHRMSRNFTLEADGVGAGRRSRRRVARGLDLAVIEAFPTFVYSEVKELKIGKAALECAVCLNEFEDDETLRLLPKCSHVFHPECVGSWLAAHSTCPVCRANLVPKPGEPTPATLSGQNPDIEGGSAEPETESITLEPAVDNSDVDFEAQEIVNVVHTPSPNRPGRSTPRRDRLTAKILKSFSTGHSLVQPGEDCERFTLRLPEEVRIRLVGSGLKRTKSCMALPMARSSRKGFRSSSGGSGRGRNFYERFDRENRPDRWSIAMTPSIFPRAGSPKMVVGGEQSAAEPRTLLKSVRSPLNRLFGSSTDGRSRGDVNVGERSFDRLRPLDGEV